MILKNNWSVPKLNFFPIIPPKKVSSLIRAEHTNWKFFCFYTFWRLLDRMEVKTKSGIFFTKSCGPFPDFPRPPSDLWCAPTKTNTFFWRHPWGWERKQKMTNSEMLLMKLRETIQVMNIFLAVMRCKACRFWIVHECWNAVFGST